VLLAYRHQNEWSYNRKSRTAFSWRPTTNQFALCAHTNVIIPVFIAHFLISTMGRLRPHWGANFNTHVLISVQCPRCAHTHVLISVQCPRCAHTHVLISVQCPRCVHTHVLISVQCPRCAHSDLFMSVRSARCARTDVRISVKWAMCAHTLSVTSSSYASKFHVNPLFAFLLWTSSLLNHCVPIPGCQLTGKVSSSF
jgi:hypothetical protein